MTYSVVYSSQTGNTAQLAHTIEACLPLSACLYAGAPAPQAAQADCIFVGFWTDKGSCGAAVAEFLHGLHGKTVFLFGTAGFGGSPDYFEQILCRVKAELPAGNTLAGTYMCQGKMGPGVRKRYESLLPTDPAKFQPLLDNFDRALTHPDQADLAALAQAVRPLL